MARGTTRSVAIVVFWLVCCSPVWSVGNLEEIPFELSQHHLVVAKGSVGPLNGLNLLIDTGTVPSMVDSRIARKLGLQAAPSTLVAFGVQVPIRSAVVDGFRFGSVLSGPVPTGIGNLSYLEGAHIDAIVGLDVLSRTSFRIDYRARLLSFAPDGREDAVAPLEIVWPFVTVVMRIEDEPVRLLVDTGSSDLVLFRARVPAVLSRSAWKGEKTVQYASGSARLRRLDLPRVRVGKEKWDRLTAWVLDGPINAYPEGINGVLGVLALGCQSVRFDFERREFGWSR